MRLRTSWGMMQTKNRIDVEPSRNMSRFSSQKRLLSSLACRWPCKGRPPML